MPESDQTSCTSTKLTIYGAGPSGASAAIAALQHGSAVQLVERSLHPKHKVCGEFLSPEILPALRQLGIEQNFLAEEPSLIRRMTLHFGASYKTSLLPEPAYGLSRFTLDEMLRHVAVERGAVMLSSSSDTADIVATGRRSEQNRGSRLFGFKAHFEGPTTDSVELFFFQGFYVGINCVEGGRTNVCGLGPEHELRRIAFAIDELLTRCRQLAERLSPLRRTMEWIYTGPLEFRNRLGRADLDTFFTGDALSFVDPFTGSGLLSAVLTGSLAGRYAARRSTPTQYLAECSTVLRKPFGVSTLLRHMASTRAAEYLVGMVPGELLFRWTRPRPLV